MTSPAERQVISECTVLGIYTDLRSTSVGPWKIYTCILADGSVHITNGGTQAVQLKDTAATLIASQSWHGGCAEHSPACLRWLCCAWHGGCTESVLEARLLAGELCRLKQRLRSSHPSECNWTSWSDILSQRLIKQTTTDRL